VGLGGLVGDDDDGVEGWGGKDGEPAVGCALGLVGFGDTPTGAGAWCPPEM
jgi:hypothetical protein